jgi:hypothetical protein
MGNTAGKCDLCPVFISAYSVHIVTSLTLFDLHLPFPFTLAMYN